MKKIYRSPEAEISSVGATFSPPWQVEIGWVPTIYRVFQVYEVGTTAGPRVPTAGIDI